MSELLIAGGTVVTADRMEPADVLIRDGRIAEVGRELTTDAEVLDATGHWVMPGGIDTHTHLAHPIDRLGIRTADDFFTGTVAGACGGVTSIIDFSLQRRGETLALARDRRLGEIAPDAVIDYGFHTIVTDVRDDVIGEVPELIDGGFPSFKVYMTYGDKIVNDDGLLRLLEATGANGGIVLVHCENDCAVTYLINQHLDAGKTGPAFHAPSRPPVVEAEATHRAIMLAGVVDAPLCIAHVTSVGAAGHVAAARERGEPVVAETCPQYLVLDDTVYDPCGGFEVAKFVCSPPMRAAEHRDALWNALAAGSIQQVSSDHAPFRYHDQKTTGRDNFTRIPNGLPGIETRLPLVFAGGVSTGLLSPQRFVELASTNPARIFGMYPRKGTIAVGADADILVWDPQKEHTISAATHHMRVDYNCYEGLTVKGVPVQVYQRGNKLVDGDKWLGSNGAGQFIPRAPGAPVL